MEFFIRRYTKGMKGSGTEDVWISSEMPSTPQFHQIAKSMGDGKYNLCLRGKGIRGFRKLDEIKIEEIVPFDAEFINVRQKVDLSALSSEEILDVMGSMISKAPNTPEGHKAFMSDLKTFHSELSSRRSYSADEPLVSAGFPIGSSISSFALGALTGGVVIWLIQKKSMDELKAQISSLETSVKEAEEAIQQVKKKADNLENRPMSVDQAFMNSFNNLNGWRQ